MKKTSILDQTRPTHSEPQNGFSRRDFLATGLALPVGVSALMSSPAQLAAQTSAAKLPELDIAEWSYFWTGVHRVDLGNGPVVNGQQMYVEYQIPAKVKYPYPIILVHGGGGQGTDWMSTPDGRRGWSSILLEQGYMVYIVDRPGHGRSPYHPDLHGGWPAIATLDAISSRFTPMRAKAPAPAANGAKGGGKGPAAPVYNNASLHNQWPGTGAVGTRELAQLVAAEGGAYRPGKGTGPDSQVQVWQNDGAEMLDKIGVPCIIMTHSAGGPFGMYLVEVRPKLVKGLIINEGAVGSAFVGANTWGSISLPMAYDPPVKDPKEIKTVQVQPTAADAAIGVTPYLIQAEPARKLKNWQNTAVAVYTSEASFIVVNPGLVHYFKQAGVKAEEIRLHDLGVHGNGHVMMGEKNNRETLKPITDWIVKNIPASGAPVRPAGSKKAGESTAMKLADQGHFWVGYEERKTTAGTVLIGQTFVQYLKPVKKRSQYPIVLVHGGGGQGTHYMGGMGTAGWAHYWVQAGYDTYVLDRPGHGRSIYHPDALGEINPVFNFASVTPDFKRAAVEPNRRWMGTGDVGDPAIDQFQAGQNSNPKDNALAEKLWARGAGELLDIIGPSIVMVHSMSGPWGWLAANERPGKVKAILNVEGASPMFTGNAKYGLTEVPMVFDPPISDPSQLTTKEVAAANGTPAYKLQAEPVRKLKNLQGVPIAYIVADRSTRNADPVVAFLKQAGCNAEAFNLKDKGILGNGHFMMLETNRKQVFDAIKGWLETKVKV
ncbi:MAG: alpha/beta fold hydrolase [Acidobacteriota bacterium]